MTVSRELLRVASALTDLCLLSALGAGLVSPLAGQSAAGAGTATVHPWANPRVGVTDFNGRGRALASLRGGLAVTSRFFVGGEGTSMLGTVPVAEAGVGSGFDLDAGYGGLVLGFLPLHSEEWRLSTTLLLGAGHATVTDQAVGSDLGADNFLIAVPEISIDWRIRPWLAFSLGAGYRTVTEVQDLPGVRSNDLAGASLIAGLQLGG